MDAQDFHSLQEAYMKVVENQQLDEATAMAKRGYDESPIRQKIAGSTGGGKFADKATALEDRPTYGDTNKQKQRQTLARAQRGDFRRTTSSNPGLHGYAHKSDDPAVKAKQAARGAQRGVLTPNEKKSLNREQVDIYDIILSHLLDEGYAETPEAAEAIMVNMSEEWREDIVEAAKDQSNKQIEKGVKTTYKAGNVLDNQHQGRSKGLNKLPAGERSAKTERMRGRLKTRRDDLFGERNRREDEARAEMKKKYGL